MNTTRTKTHPKLFIRPETSGDEDTVRQVHRLAFGRDAEADLVSALRIEEGHRRELSLVGLLDEGGVAGTIVGHIMFSHISIGQSAGLALAPVAVLPEYQKRGYGSQLVRAGLEACRPLQMPVVVLGHAEYYPRFGFERASKYGITAPFDVPDEAFLVYASHSDQLKGVTGVVKYAAAFDSV